MRKLMLFLFGTVVLFMLVSCAGFNINRWIGPKLDPIYLADRTGTTKINLAENGQCPNVTLPVNPVNIETREDKFVVGYAGMGVDHYLEPKEFIEKTVQYLEKKLIESNLKLDEQTGKKILVSLEDAKSSAEWTFETTVKLKIELPEINYSQIYSGTEGSAVQQNATAYALHLSIQEFLSDPVFQNYVKCR